ncbi:cupin [Brevibacillus ginsengisoli]|uniref:cupin n=1 Tax=Brevibacillus ginsengisoli TaxID=363854 RepID=UPI003CF32F48
MELFRFDREVGREIKAFNSTNFIMSRIGHLEEVHLGLMHIGENGVVGYHQAVTPQMFLVVAGEGWVRGEEQERTPIRAGQAAFWQTGEWHESGSLHGMTVIVIESSSLDSTLWDQL